MLGIWYMPKIAFWHIFDGANRHSFSGSRAIRERECHPCYQALLDGEIISGAGTGKKRGGGRA
jgi:hypothetical protein